MTPLILFATIKRPRPLPGARSGMYCRSFHTPRALHEHRFTFQLTAAALDPTATPATLLSGIAFERIPPGSHSAYALVVNLGGELYTVDEVVVDHVSTEIGETLVQLTFTRVECTEGEPAPVNVFFIMPLTPEIARSNRARFTFSVQHRSSVGQITVVNEVVPDCVVSLT